METELRSGFVSSSGSTTSGEEVEPVDREMEAAEALADLAHLDLREICAGGCKWGSKGRRGKKRVKSESPPSDSVWNSFTDSVPDCPDFPSDRIIANQQHEDPICGNIVIDPPKTEPDPNMCKPALGCGRSYPSLGGGRSKQNLSEAEKEERRLRRILANRESARQTIRRRQVLCDELAKKAADLRTENVKLKRDKDLAMKEFQSLETRNKQLKAQVAKVMKIETESSTGDSELSRVQMHATATNYPLFLYNHHIFSPLCWPHIIPSSNHVQSCHGSQDAIAMPSNIPVLTNGKLDSCQQRPESATDANGIRAPLYMLPYPLFFPVPDNGNALHHQPCFGVKHPQHETSAHDLYNGGSSSNACVLGEGQCSSFPLGVKSEAVSSMELRVIDDLNETPAGFPVNGDGQCRDPQPREMAFASVPPSSINHKVSVKCESRPQPEYSSSANGACSKASHLNPFTRKNEDPFKFPSKQPVDAAAAAEARRRRKELTKLKNLHGRQCRMNC